MTTQTADIEECGRLAAALRAGDDGAAAAIAERIGVPRPLLTYWDLGPRGDVQPDGAAAALHAVSALAAGVAPRAEDLSRPAVAIVVADAVELTGEPDGPHPWLPGIEAADGGMRHLLLARAEEGAGRTDEARLLAGDALKAAPGLAPAVRDVMEYELCAGNWARAFELATTIAGDAVAEPLLRPLRRLRAPAAGTERAGRNQPCPCGSGRKYKACCRAKDLEGGDHPLTERAPALYAMIATYARRAPARQVTDRISACAIGAPHAAMLALDLAIFDGGIAAGFLDRRGHLLRPDERELLADWLSRPTDMYEVIRVSRGSEVTLRSLVGGPVRLRQRDRMFSLSVRRLDIVIGRLLPDGELLPDGGKYVRGLGGLAILPRDFREDAVRLFTGGPVPPGADPAFPERLLSRFARQGKPEFRTADGDEYRFCETTISAGSPSAARAIWKRLTEPCVAPPDPPIGSLRDYEAFLATLPERFWVWNSGDEIEYAGELQRGRLTNLGTIERKGAGFAVSANSVARVAHLEAVVSEAAAAAGHRTEVTSRSARTAEELAADPFQRDDDGPGGREAMCRRLGAEAALEPVPPRQLIFEGYFLPLEHSVAQSVVESINREASLQGMLEAKDGEGLTPAEAVAAGGAARDRVLALIDDCEWRLSHAEEEGRDTSAFPRPADLRRRLGLPGARY